MTLRSLFTLGLLLASPSLVFATSAARLECTSFGSFETFQISEPSQTPGGYSFHIVDMAQLEPQELLLKGHVEATSFDVTAAQPTARTGRLDMGRFVGQKQRRGWVMTWSPRGLL